MQKIVINACFGGFNLSEQGLRELNEIRAESSQEPLTTGYGIARDDPDLVRVVEAMGTSAGGSCSKLKVVEVPDGVEWEVSEYDGLEHVAETHSIWR